ncbi:tyrosine-type recombinase/integrase [Pedobacter sp. HMF7647]|uniref:Tyrosine-type recombinase/integrase n=1 Tax=Hufsiella arboris TaxID=2695275 RepID=A0A7K1Y7N3_9SPHI|nr:site-specific integrase [Hufsiella arboris]MXV50440.1 tyrosine-type recombinase/integrase [Hufsiella arboris]
MESYFKILFYLKKPKGYSSGRLPVYARITVDLQRIEMTSGCHALPGQWNKTFERLKGKDDESRNTNQALDNLEQKLNNIYRFYREMEPDLVITPKLIKDRFHGKKITCRKILEVFHDHNEKVKALVGKEYAPGTYERYQTSLKHTADFLKWKYNLSDIDIRKIDHDFIREYDFYLRSVRNCANNSAVKYLKNFGKIIRLCLANGWISINPLSNYKIKTKTVEREFLTKEEIALMATKRFNIPRLGQVRDIFLFSCYTGLAYADVKKLKRSELVKGIDGEMWIHTYRQKTSTPSKIPLLPFALELIKNYQDYPQCQVSNSLLPVLSNQKMNAYLKEIADLCNIKKDLTFHIARHTFATTITLLNGVPIETVSKMLGHTNLKTTQHYAKILDIKVGEDMAALKKRLM